MHMFSYIRDVLHILPYAECFSMCLNLEGSNVSGKIAGRADVFIFFISKQFKQENLIDVKENRIALFVQIIQIPWHV